MRVKKTHFRGRKAVVLARTPWEMMEGISLVREMDAPASGLLELCPKKSESGAFMWPKQGVGPEHGAGFVTVSSEASSTCDTLPSTAREGGLLGAGGIRIGSSSKGERWGRNGGQPRVTWELQNKSEEP